MGVVAVAGGSGDVGRTLVDQLVSSNKHKIVVLARKAPQEASSQGPAYVLVDYNDVEETAKVLAKHAVDTIVSAMSSSSEGRLAEINLVAAAQAASTVKRFIPSEYEADVLLSFPNEDQLSTSTARTAADALAGTDLKFTRFANGMFMDYFGLPHIESYLRPFIWGLDIASRRAAIPGDGNAVITLTYSKDLARYIDKMLDTEDWPDKSLISGSDVTLNELVAIAERVTGDKFQVTYDSFEDLQGGKATVLRPEEGSYGGMDGAAISAGMGIALLEGHVVLPKDGRLNEVFPDIRPMRVEELIGKAWSRD